MDSVQESWKHSGRVVSPCLHLSRRICFVSIAHNTDNSLFLDSRANFTLISSFFLHLFVSAEIVDDARECLELLEGWRAALRLKSRSCDLLNLALLRLDGVFVRGLGELVELGEGARAVWAERGGT